MKILCVSDQIDPLVYSESAKKRFADVDVVLCAGDLPMDYVDFIVSTLNKPTYFIFGNHDLKEFCFYHRVRHTTGAHPYVANQTLNDMSHSHGAVYAGFKVLKDKNLLIDIETSNTNIKKIDNPKFDNHNNEENHKLNNTKLKKSPLLIMGISGSKRYNNGEDQYTNTEMFFKLLKLVPILFFNKLRYGRYLDIFLTHATPRHVHDREDPCHQGFECFNWFIKHFQPKYMIHGHIHLYDMQAKRVSVVGTTTIINAYSHFVFDFNQKDAEALRSSI
ncbi:MAG: metallophosphoesterase [Treponema sp.]|nr:metallophosphoesterase [Treponema sp.]